MFDEWKKAFRDAANNFWREVHAPIDAPGSPAAHLGAMRREVATARAGLRRLDRELDEESSRLAAEHAEIDVCTRREHQARDIGDEETARIAARFAERHRERAAILARKLEVLQAERDLRRRELEEMEAILREKEEEARLTGATIPGTPASASLEDDEEKARANAAFRELEREARERAAAERLEELKRRMK